MTLFSFKITINTEKNTQIVNTQAHFSTGLLKMSPTSVVCQAPFAHTFSTSDLHRPDLAEVNPRVGNIDVGMMS